ncbi:MAG: flagellar hook-basal body complex protein FliE [Desulfobacteraceae bacterium]
MEIDHMNPIERAGGITPGFFPERIRQGEAERTSFKETLEGLFREVDSRLKEADRKTTEFAVGSRQNIHEVMVAAEEAGIGFRFILEIRNKLIEAYKEIMQMQF